MSNRRLGVFVACHANVHAGVVMELISGGASKGTARPLLRSTLTRQLHRVPADVINVIPRNTTDHTIGQLSAAASLLCECEFTFPTDEVRQ